MGIAPSALLRQTTVASHARQAPALRPLPFRAYQCRQPLGMPHGAVDMQMQATYRGHRSTRVLS